MHRFPIALAIVGAAAMSAAGGPTRITSLNGGDWLLAPDPQNSGVEQGWFDGPRPGAKQTKVPWIIQDVFPDYHGVAWYWHEFTVPANPHKNGRYLLRFWQVDYKADVWLNGKKLGTHEGGETPFTLDATAAAKPGAKNLLAVRVLNATHTPIDGIVLTETAHRNRSLPYTPGSGWDQGGIMDDVELLVAPPIRVADVFAWPDWKTGDVTIEATVENTSAPLAAHVEFCIAAATTGETIVSDQVAKRLPNGVTAINAKLKVESHRLWELKDPFLYRLTVRARVVGSESFDEISVRFGFRDFRVDKGAFRLNGKRVFLRSSHTGNCAPIGLELAHDPDYYRRDLINAKFMGFNAMRFIAGVAKRNQLDLADEIGLMIYEESYASWCMAYSPHFDQRYDESVLGMVKRDRNHPSVVMFGLLNETFDGPVFQHAVALLPKLRKLDDTRLIMLNSGRWNVINSAAGVQIWRNEDRTDPCVTFNPTKHLIKALGIRWAPGQMAFHPGRDGEYAVVRWTAPKTGTVRLKAEFASIAEHATTDVHVLHNGQPLYDALINVGGAGPAAHVEMPVEVKTGDTIDFVCGRGNGDYGADTTGLSVGIDGKPADFRVGKNPNGPWSFGHLSPGATPDSKTFKLFPKSETMANVGDLSNPGSVVWQDIMDEWHPYQRVPHTADIIHTLRTVSGRGGPITFRQGDMPLEDYLFRIRDDDSVPMFISEYGIGSANDLMRLPRLYEQAGKPDAEDGKLYASWRDLFLADWERWKLSEVFGRPEDFFAESNKRMAGQRLLGLNAIRSNPRVIGYSLTGTLDQGMTSEGLWTTFRELKPGTADAVFDGFAPLRWCLFAEPVNVCRKTPVHLEAVLANEDALGPGEYPVKLQVIGPEQDVAFEKTVAVTVPPGEPPYVLPVFAENVGIDGPTGKYRFSATFQRGAAAAGEQIEFFVADPASLPSVGADVALWGDDPDLGKWLTGHGVRWHPYGEATSREVILASGKAPGGADAFRDLAKRIARGSTVIFLSPGVFAGPGGNVQWLPLKNKGALAGMNSWLYHKEEWCRRHPIFDGLPAPGLMDYTFYRELIPDIAFLGLDPPQEAVAGAIDASMGYTSGLLLAQYPLGSGRFVLNTLNVRTNLGTNPPADRLLLNMLHYAAADAGNPLAELPADWDEQLKAMGY